MVWNEEKKMYLIEKETQMEIILYFQLIGYNKNLTKLSDTLTFGRSMLYQTIFLSIHNVDVRNFDLSLWIAD